MFTATVLSPDGSTVVFYSSAPTLAAAVVELSELIEDGFTAVSPLRPATAAEVARFNETVATWLEADAAPAAADADDADADFDDDPDWNGDWTGGVADGDVVNEWV